jgi:hypothetical protein
MDIGKLSVSFLNSLEYRLDVGYGSRIPYNVLCFAMPTIVFASPKGGPKVEPKTVQGILRHSKIQTTLDLYTQEDNDQTRAAQGEFLNAARSLRAWTAIAASWMKCDTWIIPRSSRPQWMS